MVLSTEYFFRHNTMFFSSFYRLISKVQFVTKVEICLHQKNGSKFVITYISNDFSSTNDSPDVHRLRGAPVRKANSVILICIAESVLLDAAAFQRPKCSVEYDDNVFYF